jgi:DNA-binding transcriptional MerR regulator
MRINELSKITGVSVATIKYYLREGLLPGGSVHGASNQADYDTEHVHRLNLVRTLVHVGGLPVAVVRDVVAALDRPTLSRHRLLAIAHNALPGRPAHLPLDDVAQQARADVNDWLLDMGWRSSPNAPARAMLADALAALRRLGRDVPVEVFTPYARAADSLAELELSSLDPTAPKARMVEDAVIGTVVFEAALIALRRLAQANHSAKRYS